MSRYVIADAATGEIVRTVTCLPEQAAAQAQPGELSIEHADATPHTHYVAAGELVAYTSGQCADKAERPAWAAAWDNITMVWTDPRTLAERKAEKLAEMQAARDAQQYGGFTWDGSTFDSDQRSQSLLLGMFTTAALGALPDTPFRLQDNSWRVLTAADMVQVWGALQACIAGAFAQFAAREAAIESAVTQAEVETITWPGL